MIKVFEIDREFSSIEEQLKPIVEKKEGRILVPDFSTAKYEKINEDGLSFGYPADEGEFVTLNYEEYRGVLADDCIGFLDLANEKKKQVKFADFTVSRFFDYGNEVDKPKEYEVILDKGEEWIIKTEDEYFYRYICPYNECETFCEIEIDNELYSTKKEMVERVIETQKFRNELIKEANNATKDALKIIETLKMDLNPRLRM